MFRNQNTANRSKVRGDANVNDDVLNIEEYLENLNLSSTFECENVVQPKERGKHIAVSICRMQILALAV